MNKRLKDKLQAWYDKDYRYTFYERITYLAESEPLYKDLPYALRYAKTFEYITAHVSTPVDDSPLAGAVAERVPSDEEWHAADQMTAKWWDIPEEQIQKEAIFYYTPAWLRRRTPWFYALGHLALQWEDLVDAGLTFFTHRADEAQARFEADGDPVKAEFAQAAGIISRALSAYILRFEGAYRVAADIEPDPARKRDLAQVADRLRHVSEGAPRTLAEALQLIWLVVLPFMKIAGCGVFNLSHMDQYLLRFYEGDLSSGALTEHTAKELIQDFYYRLHEFMATADHMSQDDAKTQYSIELTYDDPHYMILSGVGPDGKGRENALSTLLVKASHEMKLRNPFIVVRYHPNIDRGFWREVVDAMRDNTTIVVYNDETMIPALLRYGVDERDVYDYGFYGCNDVNIPHKEGGLRQTWFTMIRPLELALNEGDYPLYPRTRPDAPHRDCQYPLRDRMIGIMMGPYYGVRTKPVSEMTCMDDVIEAFRQQTNFLVGEFRKGFERDCALEKVNCVGKFRIEDAFIEGPVESGGTWISGGTKYHHLLVQGGGIANVANSLYNIEDVVFNRKLRTLAELVAALNSDFATDPELLQILSRERKFGNDEEAVDRYAKLALDIYCDAIDLANQGDPLYKFLPTLSTDRDHTTQGREVGATPDGRRARAPLSENQSPVQGTDVTGLTALLNSVARMDFRRVVGGPLNIRIHPSAVAGEKGLMALMSAFETYFARGGMQVQINVVGRETLIAAQQQPDQYKDLCVRVTGYSAYFTQMGTTAQNEMIERSEKR